MPLLLQPVHYVANHVPHDVANYLTHDLTRLAHDITDNVTDSVTFDLAHNIQLPWVYGAR